MSYRRLEHDLYLGRRLLALRCLHRPHVFRGNAKGKGFRGCLEAEKIPPRRAYRLIQRYLRIKAIWDRIHVANAALEAEDFPEIAATRLGELEAVVGRGLARE